MSRDRGDTFYFTYQGPRPAAGRVKVDVTRAETIVCPLQTLPVLRSYPEFDFPEDRAILVYSLDEIAVEKILAVTDGARREPRDLYDLSGSLGTMARFGRKPERPIRWRAINH